MTHRICSGRNRRRIATLTYRAQAGINLRVRRFRKEENLDRDGADLEKSARFKIAQKDSDPLEISSPDRQFASGLSEVRHYCRGLEYYSQQLMEEAAASFRRAVDINPNHYKSWYCLGETYAEMGAQEEAAEAYKRVVDLRGRYKAVYYNLAHAYRSMGKKEKAVRFFKLELEHDPDDYTSRYMLAALEGKAPDSAPREFVRDVFDEYAETFDKHLLHDLEYATPFLLRKTFEKLDEKNLLFERVLDLGCGTGLAGAEFRPFSKWLEGVDISPLMIKKAREKKIYDKLVPGDFFDIFEKSKSRYDLIVAADVFVYIGNLTPVFRLAKKIVNGFGYFAFSTEVQNGQSFMLHDNGRYSHSRDYVRKTAEKFGFLPVLCEQANLRRENGFWVEGDLFIFRSSGRE